MYKVSLSKRSEQFKLNFTPAQATMLSFVALSVLGAVILAAPVSNSNGEWRDWVSAFFMSVTSVCVTGLSVTDLGQDFTMFGQSVILILVQVGGLSYMTMTTILLYMVGRKLSINDSRIFDMSNNSDRKIDFASFVLRIGLLTLIIEGIGALALLPVSEEFFPALFHSVSAFCNAGLSVYSNSMESYRDNAWMLFMISFLPILGGLGYTCLNELYNWVRVQVDNWQRKKPQRFIFSLHTRVSLTITFTLLIVGIVTQYILIEVQDLVALNAASFEDKSWVAAFQSIAARSSGFNSIPLLELGEPSLIFLILWMIIGACPGGTGGGIKVTTLAVIFAMMWAALRNSPDTKLYNRALTRDIQLKAGVVILATFFMIGFFSWLVSIFDASAGIPFVEEFFEVTSAFTTVGLSTGITADLSDASQIVLCICMLIGRPGPLLFLMALVPEHQSKVNKYPEEGILIG